MKKVLLASAVTLFFAVLFAGIAAAQDDTLGSIASGVPSTKAVAVAPSGEGTEVCVNASNAADARRRFPKATLHIIPDDIDPNMNGWRIVINSRGNLMSDAEEIALRLRERHRAQTGE